MADIAQRGTAMYELRGTLRRHLLDFQDDLQRLETEGLQDHECADVKEALAAIISAFSRFGGGPGTAFHEAARLFTSYADVYRHWNGHYGQSSEMRLARRATIGKLKEKKGKLLRKVFSRQAELVGSGQLDMFFVDLIKLPFQKIAEKHGSKFSRLHQGVMFRSS